MKLVLQPRLTVVEEISTIYLTPASNAALAISVLSLTMFFVSVINKKRRVWPLIPALKGDRSLYSPWTTSTRPLLAGNKESTLLGVRAYNVTARSLSKRSWTTFVPMLPVSMLPVPPMIKTRSAGDSFF